LSPEQIRAVAGEEVAGLGQLESEIPPRPELSMPEGSHTRLSQEGGLKATEGTKVTKLSGEETDASHGLTDHGPDVTQQELKQKACGNKSGIAGKFTDRAVMETTTADAIAADRPQVENWLAKNPPPGDRHTVARYDPGLGNLGEGYYRLDPHHAAPLPPNMPMTEVQVILMATGLTPPAGRPYIIYTTHPAVPGR
jgi:hypothetical protein